MRGKYYEGENFELDCEERSGQQLLNSELIWSKNRTAVVGLTEHLLWFRGMTGRWTWLTQTSSCWGEMDVVKMSLVNVKLEEGLASTLTSCPEVRARKDPIIMQAKAFRHTGYETVEFRRCLYRDNADTRRS